MTVTIKGFPTEISEHIELPDIAELLCYPFFFDNHIEDVMSHGSAFQKYLIDKTPLRNDKRYVSCRFEVKFIYPRARSVTGYGRPDKDGEVFEWHIDSDEDQNLYAEDNDRVHLLTSANSCMTDFNRDQFTIDFDGTKSYGEFDNYLRNNCKDLIVPQTIEPNRIVTFTNHLHRAKESSEFELRFVFRLVETNRNREPVYPTSITMAESKIFDISSRSWLNTIQKNNDIIRLKWK
jgi:hypothetical protein